MLNVSRTRYIAAIAFTLAATAGCDSASSSSGSQDAATYPTKTITLISPYDAGGSSDQLIRPIAESLEEQLGQSVVIEYKSGGSGALGTTAIINSAPDGYTIGYGTAGTLVATPLSQDVGYSREDVTTIGVIAEYPSVLAVNPETGFESAEEFFEYAEGNPGEIKVGTTGNSTPMAIEMQRLENEYGVDVTLVPFEAQPEVVAALLGGNIDATFNNLDENLKQLFAEGELVPLAVSTQDRVSTLPDVPTLSEMGYPELTLGGSTGGLIAPAGVPDDIVAKLADALNKALSNPEVRELVGEELIPAEFRDGEDFRELLDRTHEAYQPILQG